MQTQLNKLELSEIPKEWKVYPLGDKYIVTKFRSGGTPLTSEKDYWEDGTIPFVKIEDITKNKKFLLKTKNTITQKGLANSSAWLIPKNSLLLSIYASFGESIINKIPVTTNQAIIGICIDERHVDLDFIYYQLQFLKGNWLNKTQENTQKNLNSEIAKKFLIPFPILKEQQKVASILSNVDNLIQKTDQVIEQTKRLKRGLMKRLLTKGIGHTKFRETEVGEMPEKWTIKKMSDFCTIERGKFSHRPRNDPKFYGGSHPFIQTGDIERSEIHIKSYTQTLNDQGIKLSKQFPINTIVITIAANIGSVAITTFPVYFPDSMVGIVPSGVDLYFLYYYLKTKKDFLKSLATVSAQPNINLETLKPLLVPVPPLNEQQKISSVLLGLDNLIQKLKDKRKAEEHLKRGLMQQLLTGKIRVKV